MHPCAWNIAETENGEVLMDASRGTTKDGGSIKKYTDFWFDTDPYWFILFRFPVTDVDQLLRSPLTQYEFREGPQIKRSVFPDLPNHSFPHPDQSDIYTVPSNIFSSE